MKEYNPQKIEKKWQKQWAKTGLYKSKNNSRKPKFYCLDMFPYPSGEGLHVGHPKGYIATDVYSRFKRMNGFNVLHPMGWDAFGLPAENYALKKKIHPKLAVNRNIKRYKKQLAMLGFDYDWSREINTTDPDYYKWTQWIFLKLYEAGLAYESYEPINWCANCQTGLANEDLDENGNCERCGGEIVKKPMRQWVLKITAYADKLLNDLPELDWPESIKEAQKNWIGRSQGTLIDFTIEDRILEEKLTVFTTRPDTIFGVTFLAISVETAEKWLDKKWQPSKAVQDYIIKTKKELLSKKYDKEKTGVFSGLYAVNPINQEKIPIWVVNYVLSDIGTGAVMGVPAHDERDLDFAKQFDLPIRDVVSREDENISHTGAIIRNLSGKFILQKRDHHAKRGAGMIATFGGGREKGETTFECLRRELKEEINLDITEDQVHIVGYFPVEHSPGKYSKIYFIDEVDEKSLILGEGEAILTLKKEEILEGDKLTSLTKESFHLFLTKGKQVFTGEGILLGHHQWQGQNNKKAIPAIVKFIKGKTTVNYKLKDWVFSRQRYWGEPIPIIHCEKCGAVPVPEKDLPVKLPNVKSYEPSGTGESPLANIEKWVNTKCPKCGGKAKRETNTMPQWAGSSWYYLRFIDPQNNKKMISSHKESYWMPVDLYVGGTEHATRHLIYARFWHKFLYEQGFVGTKEPFARIGKSLGLVLGEDGRKMSKRWGNVINPDDVVSVYGADTLRLYTMFMGPFDQEIAWNTKSMIGSRRFLEKVWRLQFRLEEKKPDPDLSSILNKTIQKVNNDIQTFSFNTAISALMILTNAMDKRASLSTADYRVLVLLLAPFAPHLSEEIWNTLTLGKKSVHISDWPQYDPQAVKDIEMKIVVQVNGKVRETIVFPAKTPKEEVEKEVLNLEKIKRLLNGEKPKKIIYVKDKLINIVI